MGKPAQSPVKVLQQFSRIITSNTLPRRPKSQVKPDPPKTRPADSQTPARIESQPKFPRLRAENKNMAGINLKPDPSVSGQTQRMPLAEVVADCVKRWFQDTLKEAKAGDTAMQVLVSQMYYSGYGIPKDAQKGKVWMNRASKTRSSVWKVSDKPPGYNASDSDSDDTKVAAK